MTHNKKRNLGVTCDLIVHNIARDTMDGNKQRARVGVNMLERYFGKGSPLVEEYAPFSIVREMRIADLSQADRTLDRILAAAAATTTNLDHVKTSLIHEMNRVYGQDVWGTKIPDYKLYASLQQLITARKSGMLSEARLVSERNAVISHITQPLAEGSDLLQEFDDPLVQVMMTANFNKRYAELPGPNRKLIESFVTHGIAGTLDKFNEKLDQYKQVLDNRVNRALESGNLTEHVISTVREAQAVLEAAEGDERVTLIMEYADLSRELEGNDHAINQK